MQPYFNSFGLGEPSRVSRTAQPVLTVDMSSPRDFKYYPHNLSSTELFAGLKSGCFTGAAVGAANGLAIV